MAIFKQPDFMTDKNSSKSECCNSTKEGEIIKFLLSDDFYQQIKRSS